PTSRSFIWSPTSTRTTCGWACGSRQCGNPARSGVLASTTSSISGPPVNPTPSTTPTSTTCKGPNRQMSARNVAVVGFAHAPHVRRTDGTTNGVEMLIPCFAQLYEELGIARTDIGFWCSGSSDYLAGRAFSFISAIDSIGAVPPINESHVEMDAAWALYEAYIKILTGEVETALVYGFGKSSAGILRRVLSRQTDPYTVAPLWPDSVSMAGLQARIGLDSGKWTAEQMAQVALDSFAHAERNDSEKPAKSIDELLARPFFNDPLRRHDIAPITDGAAAIVLAAGDRARELRENPAWIT